MYRLNAVPRSVICTIYVNMQYWQWPGSWLHFLLFPWRFLPILASVQLRKSWFRNPVNSPVEVGSSSQYLQGFIRPRWCRICSINSILQYTFWKTCQVHNQHECSQWCSPNAKTYTDWPVSWLCTAASLLSPLCHFRQDTITWIITQGCLLYFC